ncbi:MAG TPA: UDP-glucose 4-epimerase [Planctomycetota bacterium]|nr:UDP-glucose 4-epimerase [Planctomycetota bacterium]
MKVLVTGGAGYVGSHVAWALRESGHDVFIFDDLSEGHRPAAGGMPLVVGDILSGEDLGRAFKRTGAEAVVHMAAKCLVEESVREPGLYWRINVVGSLRLLAAMQRAGVRHIVFSSSAATYGQPDRAVIDEGAPKAPCNPYGTTKLVFEQALADHASAPVFTSADSAAAAERPAPVRPSAARRAHGGAKAKSGTNPGAQPEPREVARHSALIGPGRLGYVALRYFNAAGAHSSGEIGEDHPVETHLIPNLLRAALSGGAKPLKIFGSDYPTPDGTAVRDYVHVEDLAAAHVKALEYLAGGGASTAMNLGTGRGSSILEVLAAARKVTGRDFPSERAPRRAGDPATLVASNALAREKLGWKPERSLEDIIATAWKWHSEHPKGYAGK